MAERGWPGADDENERLCELADGDFYDAVYLAVVLYTMRRRRAASPEAAKFQEGHPASRDPVLACILEYAAVLEDLV